MKNRKKRILALGLSAVMAMGALAGCKGGEEETVALNEDGTVDTSEHVDLKMYLIGERTPDFDAVYDKVNEVLEEKLNCSLSVDFLSWGEHGQKYSLLFSGGEDFDLIFTATSWAHYEQTVAMNGFKPLSEDFIKTYAPDIWEVVPEEAWDQAKIGGEIYMIPGYNHEYTQDVMAIRGDLLEKYGYEDIKSMEDFQDFAMKAAADGMYATQGGFYYQYFWNKGLTNTSGTPFNGELILYNTQDPQDLDFYSVLDWDGFEDYCKMAKEMADAGCWSRDTLNSSDDRQTGLLTGRCASMVWNLATCKTYAKQANAEHPEWNVKLCDINAGQPRIIKPYINGGVAINASSKNAERAMMALNALYTDPELYDLTYLGIEGKHWEAVGEDQYKVIDESGYGVDSNCNWGWRNMDLTRTEYIEDRTPLDDDYDRILEEWDNNIKEDHIYDSFTFDSSKVTTQVAAVEANIATYYNPLVNGLVEDVDATIEAFRESLKQAGFEQILEELNRQAEEFVQSKQ